MGHLRYWVVVAVSLVAETWWYVGQIEGKLAGPIVIGKQPKYYIEDYIVEFWIKFTERSRIKVYDRYILTGQKTEKWR